MNTGKMRATPAVMRIVLVVLLILGFVLIGSLSMRYNEMQKQTETLQRQVLAAKEENDRLKEELAAPFDEAYVRRWRAVRSDTACRARSSISAIWTSKHGNDSFKRTKSSHH